MSWLMDELDRRGLVKVIRRLSGKRWLMPIEVWQGLSELEQAKVLEWVEQATGPQYTHYVPRKSNEATVSKIATPTGPEPLSPLNSTTDACPASEQGDYDPSI